MENTFMPAEVVVRLYRGVSTSLLEEYGMAFKRTTQNSMRYSEIDVIALWCIVTR